MLENANDFLCKSHSMSVLLASWLLDDEHLVSDFKSTSVRNMLL